MRPAARAARRLRRNPTFSGFAIATLVVAVGVNGAIFGLVRGILLEDLPFRQPDDLYLLDVEIPAQDETPARTQFLETTQAEALAAEASAFAGVTIYQNETYALVGVGEPVRLPAAHVSANFFEVLGATPRIGRSFTDGGWTTREPEVVISHRLWRNELGGGTEVLGRRLLLDDVPHTVVGVMPSEFAFPHHEVALWTSRLTGSGGDPGMIQVAFVPTVVRLADGVAHEQARTQIASVLGMVEGDASQGRPRLTGLRDSVVGEARTPLLLLTGAVLLVLLIAGFNLINLFLVRTSQRQREFSVRRALGSPRSHLVGQVLGEVAWIGAVAGGLGFLLAAGILRLLPRWMPGDLPRAESVQVDATAFLTTFGLALGVALVCGLFGAWRRDPVGSSLADLLRAARVETSSARRWRRTLVVAEVALAVVVMIGAGLLLRSYLELSRVDLGFDPGPALLGTVELGTAYPEPARREAFFDDLLEAVRRDPAVDSAGVVHFPPLTPKFTLSSLSVVGEPPGRTLAIPQLTDSGYGRAAGLRLSAGRWLEPAEHRTRAPVAVVNETFVERFVPGDGGFPERAVGRELEVSGRRLRIIGVVEDVKMLGPLADTRPAVYSSYRFGNQTPPRMTVVLRTDGGDPLALSPFLRATVGELDPDLPVEAVGSLGARLASATARPRFYALLLLGFAVVATLLAAAGVYALLAQLVTDRTRDLGVRRALGAGTPDVVRLMLRESLALIGLGLLIGLAAAAGAARLIANQLYTISGHDRVTYVVTVLVVVAAAIAAGILPLRRALRIDPQEALRHE